jgi:hypothetical protein
MANKEIGDMLHAIAQHTADILGKTPEDVFVYIDAADQRQGGAVFDNLADRVIYHDPSDAMCEEIQRLWDAADPDKKWAMVFYDIKDEKFEVEFIYPDQLEVDFWEHDYREDALIARYGDKPVIYPKPDPDWHDLTEEDLSDTQS